MGRYTAPFVSTLPGTATAVTKQHNLGCDCIVGQPSILLKCLVAELGFLVGYQTSNPNQNTAGGEYGSIPIWRNSRGHGVHHRLYCGLPHQTT